MPRRTSDDKNYYIYDQYGDNPMEPIGPVGIIALENSADFAVKVNDHLYRRRLEYLDRTPDLVERLPGFLRQSYRIAVDADRMSTGEGRALLLDTVRGHDLFIICDVLNYSCSYNLFGKTKLMTPDEHYQDLKRVILAISDKARRINVIMPYLYGGRQHKRNGRESLDCAYMLQELHDLGVSNFITFDAHDPRVANAIPVSGFENIPATYQIIKALKRVMPELSPQNDQLMVISPDEGALQRALYFSSLLKAPLGTFYKRRDYTRVVNGRNPIQSHDFLGDSAEGMDILILDDMISSGDSILDIAREMKDRGANRVNCAATYGLFTNGLEEFDQAYADGTIDHIFTTNLSYHLPELNDAPWYIEVDLSKYVALLIDAINHDASLSQLMDPTVKIRNLLSSGSPAPAYETAGHIPAATEKEDHELFTPQY